MMSLSLLAGRTVTVQKRGAIKLFSLFHYKMLYGSAKNRYIIGLRVMFGSNYNIPRERSGSVVECLTRDRRAAGSSLTGVTALCSLSKTHLS